MIIVASLTVLKSLVSLHLAIKFTCLKMERCASPTTLLVPQGRLACGMFMKASPALTWNTRVDEYKTIIMNQTNRATYWIQNMMINKRYTRKSALIGVRPILQIIVRPVYHCNFIQTSLYKHVYWDKDSSDNIFGKSEIWLTDPNRFVETKMSIKSNVSCFSGTLAGTFTPDDAASCCQISLAGDAVIMGLPGYEDLITLDLRRPGDPDKIRETEVYGEPSREMETFDISKTGWKCRLIAGVNRNGIHVCFKLAWRCFHLPK